MICLYRHRCIHGIFPLLILDVYYSGLQDIDQFMFHLNLFVVAVEILNPLTDLNTLNR